MPTSRSNKPLLVLTMGDPSGIGPEVTLKALKKSRIDKAKVSLLIVGDERVLRKAASRSGLGFPRVEILDMRNVDQKTFRYGVESGDFGKASFEYVNEAAYIVNNEIKRGRKAALVTAPINKKSVSLARRGFSGHTEYLADFTGSKFVTMFLVSDVLKVAPVTRHVPLADVPKLLTREKIIKTATQVFVSLRDNFKMRSPRIGIAGLNPHAGEGGVFGREESRIIGPAVSYLKKRFSNITGPSPSDTLFHKAYTGGLDAVVCMYHDQGLIPFKMICFDKGVNVTLGLPFMRTSPDHGTAFDIAGRGMADPASMAEAIRLAAFFIR